MAVQFTMLRRLVALVGLFAVVLATTGAGVPQEIDFSKAPDTAQRVLVFAGDSWTYGFLTTNPGPAFQANPTIPQSVAARLPANYTVFNEGSIGATTGTWVSTLYASMAAPQYTSAAKCGIVYFLGINDLYASTALATTEANLTTLVTMARTTGFAWVAMVTMMDSHFGGWTPTLEANRQLLSAWIKTGASGADVAININENARMGWFGSALNTVLWRQPDMSHPSQLGYNELGANFYDPIAANF